MPGAAATWARCGGRSPKGSRVLDKGTWTPQLDYRSSLALRSERIVIDSAVPYAMRIEQIYRPAIDLSTNLTTKVRIRKRVPPARAGEQAAAAEAAALRTSRELGTFDGVSRDLRETPYAIELDLAAIEDGAQVIEAEVFDGATSLGAASLNVFLHKGLDAKLKALDSAAASATPAVRADVLFPADYIKNVNRGRIELADFNVGAEVTRAETVLAEAKGGPQKAQKAQIQEIHSWAEPATSSGTTCSKARTRSCRIASTCRRVTRHRRPRRS